MAKREILAGATDQTIDVFIQDSSSTVGAGLTGLVFNTASLVCYYRKGATGTPTALTLATQTVGGAHSDGGFVAVDGTNCPGQYRLDLSDTIVATAGMVTVYLRGASNMVPCVSEIEVVSVNKFDAVRMGMTSLPNAAAEASGGLATLSAAQASNGTINANVHRWLTGTPNALSSGRVEVLVGAVTAGVIAAASFASNALDAVWSTATRVLTAATNLTTALATPTNITAGTITSVSGAVGSVTGDVGGNVTGSVGSVAAGGITAASIATGAIDSDALAASAIDAILDDTIGDGTLTMRQALRVLVAGMAGKLSGAATTTVTIRNTADSANVIVATVDADGNRSAVTVTP